MKVRKILLGSAVGCLTLAMSTAGALAQATPLEVQLESTGSISSPSIRFVEARENAFKDAIRRNNVPVATIFDDSNATTRQAMGFSNRLHSVGIGANSQVARALCAIERTEVPTRQEDLKMVHFHLDKVAGLLAEMDGNGQAVSDAVRDTWSRDRDAMYQGMHASMETTNCVPTTVNAAIDESEAARLAIAYTAREE
ncbi:hypothetical protein [Synechococcus sp. PCC 7336]|uniref:hypothetical protein n=1 Tax=Synechococcus sp. PCC 7336 TaxID=195250 RepID=UPI000347A3C7|nr:hypothetical protein [Synechococcus sp. PCC 7336]